jgi:hypothetical protein
MNQDMEPKLIQFHAIEKDWAPAPYPAIKALPDWLKDLAGTIQLPGVRGNLRTVKQCPPFLDAMTGGYIIPLCGDVRFAMSEAGELTFECPNGDTSIETHHLAQVAGSPWDNAPVVKFMNPWVIVTPPGYSTLFLPPLNRESIPFNILAGVVDTDSFYSPVNFPAACLMQRGSKCTLLRSTPLVQVIPFKREEWHSQIWHADARRLAEFDRQFAHSHHVYREQSHHRKSFD